VSLDDTYTHSPAQEKFMITRETAINSHSGRIFYHVRLRNADGTAVRARVNGKCKLWKQEPERFQLPMKHGLRDCFYLSNHNRHEWLTYDPTEQERDRKRVQERRKTLLRQYGMTEDTPTYALRDRLLEDGKTPVEAAIFSGLRYEEQYGESAVSVMV
jgi:hypothetical protein